MKIIRELQLAGLTTLMLFGCGNKDSENKKSENTGYCLDEKFKQELVFEQPVLQQVTEGIPLTGVVEPNPDKVIHFVSLIGGIISNTNFSLGDKVIKGQVLAELRSIELSNLQAELNSLESQIKVAESKLQSTQSMFADGISSQKELSEAQSELDILKSEKLKIAANLNLYNASTEKDVFQIKAPTTGIVTAKTISAGTQISAEGESLFTVSDLSEVWIMVNVYASNVRHIQEGMTVKIKTLSYPDEIFEGKVAAITQVYDNEARVLKARVVLSNSDLKLKPGMLVDVVALKLQNMEAESISANAVVFDDNQSFVIVYKSDCELEIRRVEILARGNGTIFIKEGLDVNEKVVTKNQLLIYEQLKNLQN
ncbi:MAG: efflux RND transporter periplasmic adaptor subunit [Bacteroidales bacterium]|nr:efflux RND transporter periplasmic adaptor subunit [Bacteroidales bacterium]